MINLTFRVLLLAVLAIPLSAQAFSFPWAEDAPREANKPASSPALTPAILSGEPGIADKIVVKKAERRLYLMRNNKPFRMYKIGLGYQPAGHKRYRGDGRTPEGRYYIDQRSEQSRYRKALHISYPSDEDRLRALSQGYDPGGSILIHGQPTDRRGQRTGDWTFGCIAVSNMEIDEIWSYTTKGTPVEILP